MTVDPSGGITTDGYEVNADHRDFPAWKKAFNRAGMRVVQDKYGEWKDTDYGFYLNKGYWNGASTINPTFINRSGFSNASPFGANNENIGAWAEAVAATYTSSYGGAYPRYDENSLDVRFEPIVDSAWGISTSSRTFYTLNGRYIYSGANGVILEGTIDTDYRKLFLVDWELTVDQESSRGYFSTPVYGIAEGGGGSLDRKRNATTSSFWWVKQNTEQWWSLAWNLSEANAEGTGWGLFCQHQYGFASGAEEELSSNDSGFFTSATYSGRRLHTLAYASSERGGPIFVGVTSNVGGLNGSGYRDKHWLGTNDDGEEINSGHIHTLSYFSNGSYTYDAPLHFQIKGYPDISQSYNLYTEVILTHDNRKTHFHEKGTKPGMWRWYAPSPLYMTSTSETGVVTKVVGAGGDGDGGFPPEEYFDEITIAVPKQYDAQMPYARPIPANNAPGVLQRNASDQLREQGQNQEFGATGITGRASDGLNRYFPFQHNYIRSTTNGLPMGYRLNPVTWHISSLAKINSSGRYAKTQQDYDTQHQGGTVSNNVYFSPPEFYGDSQTIPTGTPTADKYSQVYWNWHPSIPFGVCVPTTDFATRYDGRHDGWSFISTGASGSRDTDLYFYDNSGTPNTTRTGTFTVHGNIAVSAGATTAGFWSRDIGNTALSPANAGDNIWLPDGKKANFGNTTAAPDASIYYNGTTDDLAISVLYNAGTRPCVKFTGDRIEFQHADAGSTSNIFIGTQVSRSLAGFGLSRGNNTSIGDLALGKLTQGYWNFAGGASALGNLTTGSENTAFGQKSMDAATTASKCSAIGRNSLASLVDGSDDVSIGYYNQFKNQHASQVTSIGDVALYNYNPAAGWAGVVSIGYANLYTASTSKYMTAIGAYAAYTNNADGGVYLGYKSGYYETGANKLFIDNAPRTNEADGRAKALIYGVFDAATANQELHFNSNVYISEECETNGKLHVNGGMYEHTVNIDDTDSPYTVTAADYLIFADTDANDVEIELPSATSNEGRVIQIMKVASNGTIIVTDADGNDINGSANYPMPTQYVGKTFKSNGSEWYVW